MSKIKTGTVRCRKQILNSVGIVNDVGGTSELPVGKYRVRLLTQWTDYEIGNRCKGVLIDPKDIAKSRKAGTTGYKPEDYQDKSNYLYQEAAKAAATFDPSVVYFAAFDFTPDQE